MRRNYKILVLFVLQTLLLSHVVRAYERPTMGWSSWNAYGFKINENIIKSQADAIVSTGLMDAGYIYLNIDEGRTAWVESKAESDKEAGVDI